MSWHSGKVGCAKICAAICAVWLGLTATAAQAERDWDPAKTWLFAVGILEWKDGREWPAMPGARKDRRDAQLVAYFKAQGVPADHIVYLQDRQATLRRITETFQQLLAKTKPGDTLIFYFTGHGFRDHDKREVFFANYDATDGDHAWPVPRIFDAIERGFHGDRALLMADCCFSGGLVDEMQRRQLAIACGCLCSSFSHNSSTGNWTFSDVMLSGLRGSPSMDENGDQIIEWKELAQAAEFDMAFIEEQKAVAAANQAFDKRMKLAATVGARKPRVGERIEVKWKEKWYRAQVIESEGQRLKIHYVGYESSWDEWVGPERTRPFKPNAFAPGTNVSVKWEGKWYPATVRRALYGLHFIQYDGYSGEWNEWVAPENIRKR